MAVLKHMYADQPRTPFLSGLGGGGTYTITYPLTAEDIANGNVVAFLKVPADTRVDRLFVTSDELDEGALVAGRLRSFNEDGTGGVDHITAANLQGALRAGGTVNATAGLPRLPGSQDYYIAVEFTASADTAKAGKLSVTAEFSRTRG